MNQPITLIALGGYLGAGKTTLLNEVLSSPGHERIAVVINDFGDVNIDAQLVRSRSADMLELSNGCVCCTLADGMAATIERILAMCPSPQLAIVEVSGVGDPAAVAAWGELPGLRRGGALVCVDPGTVKRHAADRWVGDTIHQQLRGADAVLLTKTDLRTGEELAQVQAWLRDLVPGARIVSREDVPPMLRSGFSRNHTQQRHVPVEPVAASSHVRRHTAWSVTFASPVVQKDLEQALTRLPTVVERVKGIVPIKSIDGMRRAVVNRAEGDFALCDDGAWDGTAGRLVLIAPLPPGEIADPTGELLEIARAHQLT